ncbi:MULTISPECIES: flagellar biosynthesis protein FlhB [Vibrio]|jgi:flagellar biosynthetic protein FlhB|uniref:Flagellar biosynthetic protein FlhB n=2 Tax=Vibrio cyclitrophicus TaxID=47951 RepID=A0A7Z1MI42_9VIBR|nr:MULTISPECIES: flagellar biosynthesis protein FlhB [Vibrio]KNH12378.1 flagellar biosynthesis protein FlhB [Vibrio lentus]MBY7663263.1 flagellar biosynthesis protein FlhB [Vibrio atlanticus]ERM61531.1 Flagellar biosynthesis protein FlhB [Vibrio cyclitrophicus FF75]KAA8597495.1 Flagellar biosynthesis protein FlhB [Vibrio cyclitrophicus]MBE8558693.1 flagellar biosynthesis protein FlhB [Vibrio sp. OPT24]|tara:strand:+ start:1079 stop:2209 length:1131 start_codon:yes stop_codon:yes gene_type:complete
MAESDGQERTEDATPKRLQQAKEKGQVARSKELASASVLIVGAISLMWFGESMAKALFEAMQRLFSLSRDEIFDTNKLFEIAGGALVNLLFPLFLILITLFVAAVIGAAGVGGVNFSMQAAMPKASKLNPLSGIKRMFGLQSWVELLKSILKVALVSGMAIYLIQASQHDLMQLSMDVYPQNIFHALDILLNFILLISCSLLIVVAIDIPFQIWQHADQLKMTKQEVKDEFKDTEGKPEVKGRIRMLQREAAQRRMMADVPQADVIVTNPEHFSVALRYKQNQDKAPIVVAKGVDHMAMKIREIARENDIYIIPAPPLARALYHTTELEQQIPDGLFTAVAQVLAYVFQLKQYRKKGGERPKLQDSNMPIPPDLRH